MNKWLGVAVALCVTFAASGAFAFTQAGAAEFKACQEAAGTQDWNSVVSNCEATLAANADVFFSHYLLGWAYMQQKNWAKCASNYEAFLDKLGDQKADEQRSVATRQAGMCYAQAGSNGKAVTFLRRAASMNPNDTQVQYRLGTLLMGQKDLPGAEQAFSKVIQLDPSIHLAHYFAGFINFNQQQWPKAKERLSKYLELKPDDTYAPEAHFFLGSMAIRDAEGSPDAAAAQAEAKTHLEQFLAAKPDAPQAGQAHYILGTLAANAEDDENAKMHYERYLELEPTGAQAEEVRQFLADLNATGA